MIKYLDIKTIISALIVAAIVSAVGIWGNSRLLDYKFEQLAQEIGSLKIAKVDKTIFDKQTADIQVLKSDKADRVLVEAKWMELQAGINDIRGDVKYLVRLQMGNKRKDLEN